MLIERIIDAELEAWEIAWKIRPEIAVRTVEEALLSYGAEPLDWRQ